MAWAELASEFKRLDVGDVLVDDINPGQSYKDAITQEWAERDHMPPGSLPKAWRENLRVYPLRLPTDGWFVDVDHSESIAALNHVPELARPSAQVGTRTVGSDKITIHDLTGTDRSFTTAIADWMYAKTLDDGHRAHGIDYESKWGTDLRCQAIWLRKVADGYDPSTEPTKRRDPVLGQVIDEWDTDFRKAAQMLDITPH